MSWLSSFLHNPIDYISQNPLKALGLLAAPLGLAAAPFLAPEIGAVGAGLFGAGEAAAGAGAEAGALGLAGAEGAGALSLEGLAGGGAEVGGTSLAGFLGGAEGPFAGIAEGEGLGAAGGGQALGYAPDFGASFDAFSGGGAALGEGGLPGGAGFGGEAAPLGGASPLQAAAEGSTGAGVSAGGADPAAGGSFWDKLVSGVQANPLRAAGIGVSGLGLGYNMLTGSRQSPEVKAMTAEAQQLQHQQAQLMSYLEKGTLPPGLQQAVQNATAAAKANAISNAARNGQSTDPRQNTALAADLAGVDRNMIALIAQQGVALMNSGLQAAQISSSLYGMLERINQQHAQQTGQAIANFAAALSGGPRINVIGGSSMGMAA